MNEKGDKCVAVEEKIKLLDSASCTAANFNFDKKQKLCVAQSKELEIKCRPIPGYAPKISGTGKDAKCNFERTTPVSAPGDYIGDCFHIKAIPPDTALAEDKYYLVSGQKNVDANNDDRELTLVSAENWWHWPPGCAAEIGGTQHQVLASQLIQAGASRRGYAYGFLTMPYKYFPGQKSFLINVPIGGYLGWRYGQAGSGTTLALAVTLGSVKANTVDPTKLDAAGKPTVTGTADVAAFSRAIGIIFDVLKSSKGKAFKAGVFVGRDIVNSDPTIDYRFNRKTWVAIQLGYDFTDSQ
ncbi:MAG: hypothetical protein HY273_17270 [Gammaproteobacteria bacterium]|nr:hypothetical protein [Gammaproteobacteria bacterium]